MPGKLTDFERDLRIEYYRTGNVNWSGHGSVTHLPTGIMAKFRISHDDRAGLEAAKAKIRAALEDEKA